MMPVKVATGHGWSAVAPNYHARTTGLSGREMFLVGASIKPMDHIQATTPRQTQVVRQLYARNLLKEIAPKARLCWIPDRRNSRTQ